MLPDVIDDTAGYSEAILQDLDVLAEDLEVNQPDQQIFLPLIVGQGTQFDSQ